MARNARMLAFVVAAACLAALPFVAKAFGSPSLVTLATRVLIYGIAAASLNLALGYCGLISFGHAAASLNLALGYCGLISFGHAAFFGVGGYAVGVLSTDGALLGTIPGGNELLVTLPTAIVVSGLLAAVIGALSLRTSGVQLIMITLAFAQMVFYLFVSLKTYGGDDGLILRRRNGLPGLDMRDDTTFYFVCLAVASLFLLLLSRILKSHFGMVLGGIRQSERRLAAIGITTYQYKLAAFVISGMGTGLAGALMANHARFVSPDMLHWTKSGELMVMVILGGVGTLFGPAIGAATYIVVEGMLSAWIDNPQIVFGPILLLIVLYSQGGVAALVNSVRWREA